ncbi:7TM diverse intracellular signaling domain-containing protein [Pedobacter sp. SYSU D00535]|uniref:sensor histidine kinase n=1 Tax=Pedobacter sp. SYSU D00535 TaxID=2810308 RepID=UPI001A95BDF4|nr:7TM diverse intracellular signaling domain-containing protein [Pedobacter sp. SYSU D00535]
MINSKNVFLAFCLMLFAVQLFGQDKTIYFSKALQQDFIGESVYVFQDRSSSLSFKEIEQQDSLFKPSLVKVPNFGVSSYDSWIRFTVVNDLDLNKMTINISNPIIDEVTLYIKKNGNVDSIKTSNYQSFKKRPYKHQYYLFDIPLKKGETAECYLKLESNQQILAPISIGNDTRIISEISISDTRTGLYLGIMLVMLLYNLFIYFTTKDRDYLVYCHYIFWVTLTQATLLGYSYRFLWPENLWMAENMVIICGAMSGIATIIFSISFLRTRKFSPGLSKVLFATIAMYVLALVVLLFGAKPTAFQIVNVNAALVSLLIMYTAWHIYRKNYAPARYFLLSWTIFFLSILIFVSKDYGAVPYNAFTIHSVEIGSALEAVFLSFALAGKINILKKEKEASQAEALAIAKENERIIREQNVILEAKVHERTAELEESNKELNITLEDLKQAQSQLVESEKMASLGQLTAGIAHEINNPINFVTSNVTPLKRDVEMLIDTLNTIEQVGLSEAPPEEKRRHIEEYKEEMDFDYLKTEISYLLKGIHEGASRTAEIVKGLRIFSRVDEDDLKRADINEGLDSTLVIVNNLLNKINLVKEYEVLPLAECYPGKLNQVFLNIITNAIHAINSKFHGEAGGELYIKTHADQHSVFITFKDNGTGMDDKTMKKIFEPFFTTKEVGEGTGLGMSIAYNTIKKHNGQIKLSSEVGKGTEFVIQIPVIHEIVTT